MTLFFQMYEEKERKVMSYDIYLTYYIYDAKTSTCTLDETIPPKISEKFDLEVAIRNCLLS